jgi:5-methylcytosine-specific restriction protein B
MGSGFLELALDKELASEKGVQLADVLLKFFTELKKAGAEFGYRSASEIKRFAAVVEKTAPEWTIEAITDAAIMQKLLPKLHGSRRKLEPVLKTLIGLCIAEGAKPEEYITHNTQADVANVLYPVSLEKIQRMYRGLIDNGFTSYAEA